VSEHRDPADEPVDAPAPEAAADELTSAPAEPRVPDQDEAPHTQTAATAQDAPLDAGSNDHNTSAEESLSEEPDDELADDEQAEAAEPPPAKVPVGPVELTPDADEEIKHEWYILKVQSNRERSVSDALRRKVAIEGLDAYFDDIRVPTEKVTEFKGGKKKIVERKIWPGYIAVHMHVNDDTWFAIRETSGIGDFTGSGGKPTPMTPGDIAKIMPAENVETEEAPKLDIKFKQGDKVKVMEGNFENFEGEVSGIDEAHGRVTVMLSIFGRPTPVELEYWQVEVV
jgi:transcriptional antiterminator NusG